ncbi:Dyp-type peroxidase [Pseudoduganella chitinolytica]|uniref:Dyp-type peroxidase n=1 Tax=Pseudoduganella chitinolytica TaxID=34070 RepID=A0ABY8B9G8_9BURK|nr:Dyp-type peroxidase domain-containing protein [Pseudoduganella chitinolytica]WEF32564.1 Dyp-type peroxidase [Pseudoduganella chitinolytica]
MSILEKVKALVHHEAAGPALELDDIQATVLFDRPDPYFGTHVLLRFDTAAGGRALLARLAPHVRSAADARDNTGAWIAVALSHAGLQALELDPAVLESFPAPFRAGMAARADRLQDVGPNAPEGWEAPYGSGQLHLAVSIFAPDEVSWRAAMDTAREQFAGLQGVTLLGSHDFGAQPDSRNPFGYRDNIGNPAVEGSTAPTWPGQGRPVKAGEFILGYPGEAGVPLAQPGPEEASIGRNGTYVVLRKYHADIAAFNRFLREHGGDADGQELLAAKLVGRWRSGAPLALAPDRDDPALGADRQRNNDFTYAQDQEGLQVPHGCHMRRMNPRDSKLAILTDVNLHRLIRRSTTFGPPYDPDLLEDDGAERGLFFIGLSAKAHETMEFMQQEWINHGNFIDLADERDPIVGQQPDGAIFTVPERPVRRRIHGIQSFCTLRGGEYLFMPGLEALRRLADPSWELA